MGVLSYVRNLLDGPAPKAGGAEFVAAQRNLSIDDEIRSFFLRGSGRETYRLPSVREALGVPAIHRAVALIASTTGMLSVQGYRNGSLMAEAPRLITRPDPSLTPYAFYSGSAAAMAKYGELVWWIASRDGENAASALVLVPLNELQVEDNPRDRLRPVYRWGDKVSTRWSPVSTDGQFVHVKYPLGEPLALRGEGPLQLCNAATSVAVESQTWAAQFYADGGNPSVVIKHAGELSPDEDLDGLNEADRLRAQWVNRPNNVPRIIDQNIESVDYKNPAESSAQMLDARQFNNGDAAREFGVPGSLLEYQAQGSSLTYQNLEGEFTKLVKVCLQPLYLEPMEQALSDLLSRSTVARFNVKGFLRADVKTRWEIYQIMVAVLGPERAAEIAAVEEGIEPGDVEYAPVPFSPPQAAPVPIPRVASRAEMRDVRCPTCQRRVGRVDGRAELYCRHCKSLVKSEAVELSTPALKDERSPMEVHLHLPEGMVNVGTPVNIHPSDVHVHPGSITFEPGAIATPGVTVEPAVVNVTTPEVRNEITVEPAAVTVEPTPVQVDVHNDVAPTPVELHVEPTPVSITNAVEPTPVQVDVHNDVGVPVVNLKAEMPASMSMQITSMPDQRMRITALPAQKRRVTKRDPQGRIEEVTEEPE